MLVYERLIELLDFDPKEGVFYWKKKNVSSNGRKGNVAGSEIRGYRYLGLDGGRYLAHRVAWFYVYKVWPQYLLDHVDGDGLNNKISNLRDVPPTVNSQNMRWAHRDSQTGLLGVRLMGSRWQARIRVWGKEMYLGTFGTPEEAHEAYLTAKRRMHEGNTL